MSLREENSDYIENVIIGLHDHLNHPQHIITDYRKRFKKEFLHFHQPKNIPKGHLKVRMEAASSRPDHLPTLSAAKTFSTRQTPHLGD